MNFGQLIKIITRLGVVQKISPLPLGGNFLFISYEKKALFFKGKLS